MHRHTKRLRLIGAAMIAGSAGWVTVIPSAATGSTNCNELRAELTSISENRGANGKCYLGLKFTADFLTNKLAVLSAKATRAVDDLGADLCLPPNRDFSGAGSGVNGDFSLAPVRGWFELRPTRTRFANMELRQATRAAKFIKELEGELVLYSPTIQNGGVVICPDFRRNSGVVISSPALDEVNVRLTWHTKETYEHSQATTKATPAGTRRFADPTEHAADRLFPGILGDPNDSPQNYLVFHLDDPDRMVTSFAFRLPDGKFLPVPNRRSAKDLHGYYFDMTIPGKLDLFVYLAAPGAIEKVPFKLENVLLP